MGPIGLFQLGKGSLKWKISEHIITLNDLARLRTSYAAVNGTRSLSDIRNRLI